MKKQLALGIAGASAALIGGWRLINQLVNRDGNSADEIDVTPVRPAGSFGQDADKPVEESGSPKVSASSSKAELYEIAQELDIEGRSTMTKDQLLKAIQQAG